MYTQCMFVKIMQPCVWTKRFSLFLYFICVPFIIFFSQYQKIFIMATDKWFIVREIFIIVTRIDRENCADETQPYVGND